MEKRVLIAIVLSIAVMYGYSILFPQQKRTESIAPTAAIPVQEVSPLTQPGIISTVSTPLPVSSPESKLVVAKEILVDTDVYSAVLSTDGGALKKLVLKQFKDVLGKGGKEIVLFREDSPSRYTLATAYPGFYPEKTSAFAANTDRLVLTGSEKKSIELVLTTPSGLQFKKVYTFSGTGYDISLEHSISNFSSARHEGELNLYLRNRSVKPTNDNNRFEVFGPVTLSESGVTFDNLTDLGKAEKSYTKGLKWSGFGDKYFLNAVLLKNSVFATLSLKDTAGVLEQRFSTSRLTLDPRQVYASSCTLYFGPKDIDLLKAQGDNLEGSIDLGWFTVIAKPMLHSLKLFYRYLHNYGLAIILITIILKILFFPLTHKSYKSMKEMQKLQPKMQELKEKFKDDRDGLNKSVMELYKTHKVNPMGGCLPMVVQIPVFFGLYKALMFSIELRHAPFYFWIQDLSAKDPYYITPIIMGATMFIQQKMTPTNMDPIQAKMMLALPVVFTFMFLNFPSGLVLYWLVNNILTIAQQAYINRSLKEA
jgi:YidC/Oxa1 family membrane protein insertase